jgi:hypothetical protein
VRHARILTRPYFSGVKVWFHFPDISRRI